MRAHFLLSARNTLDVSALREEAGEHETAFSGHVASVALRTPAAFYYARFGPDALHQLASVAEAREVQAANADLVAHFASSGTFRKVSGGARESGWPMFDFVVDFNRRYGLPLGEHGLVDTEMRAAQSADLCQLFFVERRNESEDF